MRTLFLEDDPQVRDWLARRRELGQDGRDEVWEGVHHVVPQGHGRNGIVAMELSDVLNRAARAVGLTPGGSFDLGSPDDFRVPDLGFHRDPTPHQHHPTAALVVEVVSPRDETFAKFGFYAAREVDELWVADPLQRTVRIWQRRDDDYVETGVSALLGLTAEQVVQAVRWPGA